VIDEVQWIARQLRLVAICYSQNMHTQLDWVSGLIDTGETTATYFSSICQCHIRLSWFTFESPFATRAQTGPASSYLAFFILLTFCTDCSLKLLRIVVFYHSILRSIHSLCMHLVAGSLKLIYTTLNHARSHCFDYLSYFTWLDLFWLDLIPLWLSWDRLGWD
jgi:hypothetical protein